MLASFEPRGHFDQLQGQRVSQVHLVCLFVSSCSDDTLFAAPFPGHLWITDHFALDDVFDGYLSAFKDLKIPIITAICEPYSHNITLRKLQLTSLNLPPLPGVGEHTRLKLIRLAYSRTIGVFSHDYFKF